MRGVGFPGHLSHRARNDASLLIVDGNLITLGSAKIVLIRPDACGGTYSRVPSTASIFHPAFRNAEICCRGHLALAVRIAHLSPSRQIVPQLDHLRTRDQVKLRLLSTSKGDGTGEGEGRKSSDVLAELPSRLQKAIIGFTYLGNQLVRCCHHGEILLVETPESRLLSEIGEARSKEGKARLSCTGSVRSVSFSSAAAEGARGEQKKAAHTMRPPSAAVRDPYHPRKIVCAGYCSQRQFFCPPREGLHTV